MTTDEAIKRIEEHKRIHHMEEPQAVFISEALDMAIDALKRQAIMEKHNEVLNEVEKMIVENRLYFKQPTWVDLARRDK